MLVKKVEEQVDIRAELEKHMSYTLKTLDSHLEDGDIVDYLINYAIDAQLYVDLSTKEPTGFDIGITIGGPNIRLVYDRGACKLQGAWGSAAAEKYVNNEICETILDYFSG